MGLKCTFQEGMYLSFYALTSVNFVLYMYVKKPKIISFFRTVATGKWSIGTIIVQALKETHSNLCYLAKCSFIFDFFRGNF